MKNIIKSAIVVLVSIFSLNTNAQSKTKQENSLLWEVSGNGLSKPSYLFGTVHMICEKDFLIKEKVQKAFDKSSKLALELDFDDPSEIKQMQEVSVSKTALTTLLTNEDYKKLDAVLKEKVGAGANQFENTSLTSLLSMIMFKAINCTPKMYEFEFLQMAQKRQMEVLGLEKIAVQMEAINASSSLHEMVEQLGYYDGKYFEELIRTYKSEDLNSMYDFVNDPKFINEKGKLLTLDNRNRNWVKNMPEMMKNESVFFAVGAAHLPGNEGVINLLRKKGYIVKPILN